MILKSARERERERKKCGVALCSHHSFADIGRRSGGNGALHLMSICYFSVAQAFRLRSFFSRVCVCVSV